MNLLKNKKNFKNIIKTKKKKKTKKDIISTFGCSGGPKRKDNLRKKSNRFLGNGNRLLAGNETWTIICRSRKSVTAHMSRPRGSGWLDLG